jgi:hypothetical protein
MLFGRLKPRLSSGRMNIPSRLAVTLESMPFSLVNCMDRSFSSYGQ